MKRSARMAGLRIIFLLAFLIPGMLKALFRISARTGNPSRFVRGKMESF